MKENMQELAIEFRVYYKLMSTTVEPRTKIIKYPMSHYQFPHQSKESFRANKENFLE